MGNNEIKRVVIKITLAKNSSYGLYETADKCKTPIAGHPSFNIKIDGEVIVVDSCWKISSFETEQEAKAFAKANKIPYVEENWPIRGRKID